VATDIETYEVNVFINGSSDNVLCIGHANHDDLETGVTQCPGDNGGSAPVAIKACLGH
jgi:hypothetical protein